MEAGLGRNRPTADHPQIAPTFSKRPLRTCVRGLGSRSRSMAISRLTIAPPIGTARPSFRKPRASQALREYGQVFRTLYRKPVLQIGNPQRGIELSQVLHRVTRRVCSSGESVARGDDADHQQEARDLRQSA